MKKVFLILFLCGFLFPKAQNINSGKEWYDYPLEESYKPLTIQSNLIMLYRTDGSGNFDFNNPEQKSLFNDYLDRVNEIYSNNRLPFEPQGCNMEEGHIKDTKIRFDYNVVTVKNNYYWDYLNSGAIPEQRNFAGFSPTDKWYIAPLDDSIKNVKSIPDGINVYLTSNGAMFDEILKNKSQKFNFSGHAAAQFPSDRDLNRSSQLHLPNRFLKYIEHRYNTPTEHNTTWEESRKWHVNDASGMAHEFGHNLGLRHSSEYYKTNECPYAVMSQKGGTKRIWFPLTEVKKMHWNLTRTNLMQFVTPESAYDAVWTLKEDTVWDKPRRFYHNFELAKNVTLTITEPIILPPGSFVKLNRKSKIIFSGDGSIKDAYGREFNNYIKKRKSKIIRK